jgi:hypothetical protein
VLVTPPWVNVSARLSGQNKFQNKISRHGHSTLAWSFGRRTPLHGSFATFWTVWFGFPVLRFRDESALRAFVLSLVGAAFCSVVGSLFGFSFLLASAADSTLLSVSPAFLLPAASLFVPAPVSEFWSSDDRVNAGGGSLCWVGADYAPLF